MSPLHLTPRQSRIWAGRSWTVPTPITARPTGTHAALLWQYNDCMSPHQMQGDEVLEQVLEDECAAAVQEFREREEVAIDAAEQTDA